MTATINFVSVSDDELTVLVDGDDQALTIEANGFQLVAFEYVETGTIFVDQENLVRVIYNGKESDGRGHELAPGYMIYHTPIEVVLDGDRKGIALLVIFNTTDAEANITVDIETTKN